MSGLAWQLVVVASTGAVLAVSTFPGHALPLGVALVVGALLALWARARNHGLRSGELTALVRYREALLRGVEEGVLALDPRHRITLVNDRARELLALPADCVGRSVHELGFDERVRDALTGRSPRPDQLLLGRGRVVVLTHVPLDAHSAVVTVRDRTELTALRQELDACRRATDALRAQAHEFSNRLHAIAGLVEMGRFDEVRGFIERIGGAQGRWHAEVREHIADPAVAALLIAKSGLAGERGVGLRLSPGSALGEVDEALSTDLVTVLGNLVDNAVDALGSSGGWVEVSVREDDDEVLVVVRDSGPGVAPELADEVFRHGFTTKAGQQGARGLGLALTRQTCLRRGGSVRVHNDGGAVFTAHLPTSASTTRCAPGGR
ncbi:sensor histidine kinase regulating citrate/malate metabolism [Saccharothrix coeruleofusca]|uniref:sensor histidine kinase n=1 Tax=Saccharothrix coeruleofusca TaxID=33919 RepID=UPI0027DC8F7D|nr:ATP-binding protein [Saccharothrix coeruleofusca]MBP2339663.1 sensor histidine kinase regulating citrate/malate metabolism [Saccharothrix coeruleofusca]